MKKAILFLMCLCFLGCSDDDGARKNSTVTGRIVREATGEGIANQTVYLTTRRVVGSGAWSYIKVIDEAVVTTDANGVFTVSINADPQGHVNIYKPQDNTYTGYDLNYGMDEDKTFYVDKFAKFKIYVNNTNPSGPDDFVHVDLFSSHYQSFMTGIENFGVQNTIHPPEYLAGGGMFGGYEEASWTGANVNSFVYFNISERSEEIKLIWSKRENGVETTGFTESIPFQADQINEYHFDY